MTWKLLGFKCSLPLHNLVAEPPVFFSVVLLAFNRTVICGTTSSAIEHFAALHFSLRQAASLVAAKPHLLYGLHFFVHLFKANTSNALPIILNKRVNSMSLVQLKVSLVLRTLTATKPSK